MKLSKEHIKRLKNADFYQLFVIDKLGVGYASQSGKNGVSRIGILTLIERLEKEKQYLTELLEKGTIKGIS